MLSVIFNITELLHTMEILIRSNQCKVIAIYGGSTIKKPLALARVAQLVECSVHQMVAGLIPSQST